MNNVFFKNGFLTSTEAQNICNVANEVIAGLTDSLNTVQFYNTTITSIVSSDNAINAGRGTTDTLWIRDAIIKIGQYNSLIAWLKEAIKNKEEALGELSSTRIQDWSEYKDYPTPKSPSKTSAESIITTPAITVGSNFSPGLNVNKHSNGWKNVLFST